MSYRDDYAAALARANAAERNLRELERQASADKAQLKALNEELERAKAALREAQRRAGVPQPSSNAANFLPFAIFAIFAVVLWGWLSTSGPSHPYPYENIPSINFPITPYLPLPTSMPDIAELMEAQKQIREIQSTLTLGCSLPASPYGEYKPVSFQRFTPPEGCLPALLATPEDARNEIPAAPLVIESEASFKKNYRCTDAEGNTFRPTSGTDFSAYRLVLMYQTASDNFEPYIERVLSDGKEISLGLSERFIPSHDAPEAKGAERLYALQILLPRGKQKIIPKQCFPQLP